MLRITLGIFVLLAADMRRACSAIIVDTVPVGNVGNPADPIDGDAATSGVQHFGAVAYEYRIGTYEVTNDQYAAFLNAVAAADSFGLYSSNMGSDVRGGITQSGASGSFSYATKPNMGNKPVNFVSWYDAVRFANWLHNNQPAGTQGNGTTETGAYTLLGGTAVPSNGNTVTRNAGASWYLTSENEWYKAAYHKNDGLTANYWHFPTSSDSQPAPASANAIGDISNPGANVVNYRGGAIWNGPNPNVTTVGSAGALSASPYLTFDQGGT